jgi:hypothetical protein
MPRASAATISGSTYSLVTVDGRHVNCAGLIGI